MSAAKTYRSDLEAFLKALTEAESDDQRKGAYRSLVERYHPDKKPEHERDFYHECMIQINLIYASTKTKVRRPTASSGRLDGLVEKYWNGLNFEFTNRIGIRVLEGEWEIFAIKLGMDAMASAEHAITSNPAAYGIDMDVLNTAIQHLHFALEHFDLVLRSGQNSNWIREAQRYRQRAFDMNTRITKNYLSHVKRSIRIV